MAHASRFATRQFVVAVAAMCLVLAVAAYDQLTSKTAARKVQISGSISQWSALGLAGRDNTLSFRVGSFPFDLAIDAQVVQQLAQNGMAQPLDVGAQAQAIVARSEVIAARERVEHSAGPTPAIEVLALRVEGQTVFGTPDAFKLGGSISGWTYILLLSAAGAALSFGHKRQRRGSRRA